MIGQQMGGTVCDLSERNGEQRSRLPNSSSVGYSVDKIEHTADTLAEVQRRAVLGV